MINRNKIYIILLISAGVYIIGSLAIFFSVNNSLRKESTQWNANFESAQNYANNADIKSWIVECNQLDKGVYVLKNTKYAENKYYTTYCIYRTDISYESYAYNVRLLKSWTNDEKVKVSYDDYSDVKTETSDETILYIQCVSKDGYIDVDITGGKNENKYEMKETDRDLNIN